MRKFALLIFLFTSVCACASQSPPQPQQYTQWDVKAAPGLDAVLLIGAMSGDKLQAHQYPEEIARYRAQLNDEELAGLNRIGAFFASPGNGLAGPKFIYSLAGAPNLTFDGVKTAIEDADGTLRNAESNVDDTILSLFADLAIVYAGLERAGFRENWRDVIAPVVEERTAFLQSSLDAYNIIPLQEHYLGRDLANEIDVLVLHFNKPYGIRVHGQRFATFHGWDRDTTLRTAIHEIFHPPFDPENPELRRAGARIAADPLIKNVIARADPAFGYKDLGAIVDEGSTQALDMLVSRKLGIHRDPGEYWREQDGGMHIFAAAAYDAMIETGFAETGGVYEEWLIDALSGDTLSPEAIERRARKIVGDGAVDKWMP